MDNSEEECTRPVMVTSQPTKNYGSRGEWGEPCELLPRSRCASSQHREYLTVFTRL